MMTQLSFLSWRTIGILGLFTLCLSRHGVVNGFSGPNGLKDSSSPNLSRRDLVKYSVGAAAAIAYGKVLGDAAQKLSRGTSYPIEHDQRVESTITRALLEASSKPSNADVLRVLEVGIGSECRTIREGLYNKGVNDLALSNKNSGLEFRGVDLKPPPPRIIEDSRERLQDAAGKSFTVDFDAMGGDISSSQLFSYPNGYFDSIICCLTLCSVTDPPAAVQEMKRLLRHDGGTFGYVEHVAVDPNERYPVLEMQQRVLDPLQQLVADNCHLHRYTEATITDVYGSNSRLLQHERFLVKDMWPVSCQCCGVIQRTA